MPIPTPTPTPTATPIPPITTPLPTPTQAPPFKLSFQEIKLESPHKGFTDFKFIPGTKNEFLVLEQEGRVTQYRLEDDTAQRIGYFQVENVVSSTECGLLTLAFDPDFQTNHFLYLGYCPDLPTLFEGENIVRTQNDQFFRIGRFVFDPAGYESGKTVEGMDIITVGDLLAPFPVPQHTGGAMGFEPDGTMWAFFGERLAREVAQDWNDLRGSMVRIIPNRDPGGSGYTPANGNLFLNAPAKSPIVYAKGFRNPWRALLDSKGRYWVADPGEAVAEEIDVVTRAGQNFGWPYYQGPCFIDLREAAFCRPFTDPIRYWDHTFEYPFFVEDPEAIRTPARVAWVGMEYLDKGNDRYGGQMTNRVTYGEMCVGWVRAIQVSDLGQILEDRFIGHLPGITSWDQEPDGYMYAASYGTCEYDRPQVGRLYRAVPEQ